MLSAEYLDRERDELSGRDLVGVVGDELENEHAIVHEIVAHETFVARAARRRARAREIQAMDFRVIVVLGRQAIEITRRVASGGGHARRVSPLIV